MVGSGGAERGREGQDGGVGRGHKLKDILQNSGPFTARSRTQNKEPFECILVLRLILF